MNEPCISQRDEAKIFFMKQNRRNIFRRVIADSIRNLVYDLIRVFNSKKEKLNFALDKCIHIVNNDFKCSFAVNNFE